MWFEDRAGERVRVARWCLAPSSSQSWGNCQWDGSDSIHPTLSSCHCPKLQLIPCSLCLTNLRSSPLMSRNRFNQVLRPRSLTWMINRRQRALNRQIGHNCQCKSSVSYLKVSRWGWSKLLCRRPMTIWGTIGEVLKEPLEGARVRLSLGMIRYSESRRIRRSKWDKSWVGRSLKNITTTWLCLNSLRIQIKLQRMSRSVTRINACP